MKIERNMNLLRLAQRMGSEATEAEAARMRDILVGSGFDGVDTTDIDDPEWTAMLDAVVAGASS